MSLFKNEDVYSQKILNVLNSEIKTIKTRHEEDVRRILKQNMLAEKFMSKISKDPNSDLYSSSTGLNS